MRFCYAQCMCFYPIFYLPNTHIVSLYTFIVLLSYLIVVIYISVPVCTICGGGGGGGQNTDEKYDQCILYLLLDIVTYSVLSQVVSWCKQTCRKQTAPTLYFNKPASVLNIFRFWEPSAFMIYSLPKLP